MITSHGKTDVYSRASRDEKNRGGLGRMDLQRAMRSAIWIAA
jgi:hypothetical protein